MKVVLDTNVLVAAFIAHGRCAEVLENVLSDHELVVDRHILGEIEAVLLDKLKFPPAKVSALSSFLGRFDRQIDVPPLEAPVCRDPDDDAILALARSARADCIVSGDQDLLSLASFEGVPIVDPKGFWALQSR